MEIGKQPGAPCMKKSYSTHLGEIEDKNFQATLDKFSLGRLLRAEAIPHGLFGKNVLLDTTQGQFVFRGRGQFRNERYMAERLHAETKAPVPWPYLLDESNEIFDWHYVIMPRMPGLPLESPEVQASLSTDDRIEIAGVMGGLLRELQNLHHSHCGLYDEDAHTLPPLPTIYTPPWEKKIPGPVDAPADAASAVFNFQKWIPSRIRWHMDTAVEFNDASKGRVTTPADVKWFESLLEDSQDALSEPFQPTFVMDDFKEGNTVMTKIDGRWKVTGVFDLGTSYFGDGEADIARILLMYGMGNPNPAIGAVPFLKSYFQGTTRNDLRPGFSKRAKLYFLMESIVFWYFFRRRGTYDAYPDFRSWFEPQLENFQKNLSGILSNLFTTS